MTKKSPQKERGHPFDMEADIEEVDTILPKEPGDDLADSFLMGDEKLDLSDLSQSIQIL